MRRWRWRTAALLGVLLLAAAAVLVATDLSRDPTLYPPAVRSPSIAVFVVSNGFHTGLALPQPELARIAGEQGDRALIALTQRFGSYDFLEVGWGEENFYRGTPTLSALKWEAAFRALFLKNRTVVQVVGLTQPPQIEFSGATMARVNVSEAGLVRLAALLDKSFALTGDGTLVEVGPGLYGPSLFFRARGHTSLFNVCNSWIGRLLHAAGLPNTPGLTVTANGLFADLQFRAGVRTLRQRQN